MALTEAEIEKLLQAMNNGMDQPQIEKARFASLQPTKVSSKAASYDCLDSVPLRLVAELGRTRLKVKEILDLKEGSLITLDKLVGEPLEVRANGVLLAFGEVVVINEAFGIKINNLASVNGEGQD